MSPRDDTRGVSSSTSDATALRSSRPMPARALGSLAGGSTLRGISTRGGGSSSRSSLTSILVRSLGRSSGRRSSTSAGAGASHDGPVGKPGSGGAPTDGAPADLAADRFSATSARLSAVISRRSNSRILLVASASSASARRALSPASITRDSASPPRRSRGSSKSRGGGGCLGAGGGSFLAAGLSGSSPPDDSSPALAALARAARAIARSIGVSPSSRSESSLSVAPLPPRRDAPRSSEL
mmetsp:Transcript_5485/g.24203  ORF Transcript_5485/g.24203 Transcript_5485/m.24203 type:complete len:240 (-) Transcript_5485:551-1270(-)